MKRNMSFKKRLFYVFLVALLCFSSFMLVGCSEEEEVQYNSSGEEIVELTWYTIGTPQKDLEMVVEAANEYTAEKIGVTVDMVMIDYGDYDQKIQTMISSGEQFDICFTSSWAGNYAMNAQNGAFVDITEMMAGSELEAAIDPALLEGATINGSLYAVPTNKETGSFPVIVFNTEMAERNGIDLEAIDSFDDLTAAFETIQTNEPGVTPMKWSAVFPVMDLYGEGDAIAMSYYGEEEFVNKWETPEVQKQLALWHEWYEAGYLPSDAATNTSTTPWDSETWFCRKEFYSPGAEKLWEDMAGYDLTLIPIFDAPMVTTGSVTGSMMAISATSDHPEEAFEYIQLLNTDPYLRTLIDYGIEGVHYEDADGDGFIEWLPAHENYTMPSYTLGNMFILPLVEGEPATKWEDYEAYNAAAVTSPTLGFYFNDDEVQTEVAAMSSVAAEFGPALLYGSVDPAEYIPKMNAKLEEAGIDKVLEEVNKQYDAWKEARIAAGNPPTSMEDFAAGVLNPDKECAVETW